MTKEYKAKFNGMKKLPSFFCCEEYNNMRFHFATCPSDRRFVSMYNGLLGYAVISKTDKVFTMVYRTIYSGNTRCVSKFDSVRMLLHFIGVNAHLLVPL